MPSRTRLLIAFLLVLDVVLVPTVWSWRADELTWVWYRAVASGGLSASEADALQGCRDPGWWGWVRVLEHDLEVRCAPSWVVETMARDVGARRATWLTRIALHPGKPARERRRAGLVLRSSGRPPIRGLSLLLSEPDVSTDERAWVASSLSATDRWADPSLQLIEANRQFLDGDPTSFQLAADGLRLDAATPRAEDLVPRLKHALSLTDLAGLERWRRRLRNHLPLGDAPEGFTRRLQRDPKLCSELTDPECVDLVADHLVAQLEADGEGDPEDPAPEIPACAARPLWDAIADRQTADAHAREFARYARWIGDANRDEGALRLLGVVAHRRHGFTAEIARAGALGDPSAALRWRRSGPWTSALAAATLGKMSGFQVEIRSIGGGILVAVAGHRAAIGPCGATFDVPDGAGEPWPYEAILAQAAIEGTGAALRSRDVARARRLALLAERSDPLGAAGVVRIVEALAAQIALPRVGPAGYTPPVEAAATALARMVPVAGHTPDGAIEDRKALSKLWERALAEWNQPGDPPACPTPLGP